jgi:hypothetical protein
MRGNEQEQMSACRRSGELSCLWMGAYAESESSEGSGAPGEGELIRERASSFGKAQKFDGV